MLNKLQQLEQKVLEITKRYNVVATELANLKNKPNNDAKNEAIIRDLSQQLTQSQSELGNLKATYQTAHARLDELTASYNELSQTNARLSQENHALKEKNRLAIERAEQIQQWLYNIDNAKNS